MDGIVMLLIMGMDRPVQVPFANQMLCETAKTMIMDGYAKRFPPAENYGRPTQMPICHSTGMPIR